MQHEITNQDIETIKSCPVCLNENFEKLSEVILNNNIEPFFTTDICLSCHTVVRLTHPSQQWFKRAWEYRNLLAKEYNYSIRHIFNKLLEELRYIRYSNLEHLFSKLTNASSIIDIGTGPGTGLRAFSENSWDTVGLEPDPTRADLYKHKFNFTIHQQTIECFIKNKKNIEQFDIATVIHTLEHCHNPLKFLDDVIKVIKPKGYLYIEVPNSINFINWKDSLYLEHLFNFNLKSLIILSNKLELEPNYIFYPKTKPNGFFHLGILFKKATNSNFRISLDSDNEFIENIKSLYKKGLTNPRLNVELKYIVPKIDNLRSTFSQYFIVKTSQNKDQLTIFLEKQNTSIGSKLRGLRGLIIDYINYLILFINNRFKVKFIFKLNNNLYDKDFFNIKFEKFDINNIKIGTR